MPRSIKPASKPVPKPAVKRASPASQDKSKSHDLDAVVASLKRLATKKTLVGMARFAIPSDNAFGVAMGDLHQLAKELGRSHELAAKLWASGWYEARLLATFVEEPQRVTAAQMDHWCRDFDSWAICDTACFHLFDRTPHAWRKVAVWANRRPEFEKRAAFALLASLVAHDKQAGDEPFAEGLTLVEAASTDERNFVKKAVNWALRCIGKRNLSLHTAALAVAQRLAESPDAAPRWIGKDALRELSSAAVTKRLAAKSKPTAK